MGIEPISLVWKTRIITIIRHPQAILVIPIIDNKVNIQLSNDL